MQKKRGLGRGLDALLSGAQIAQSLAEWNPNQASSTAATHANTNSDTTSKNELQHLALTQLRPGAFQPRRHFTPDSLRELADSIKSQGVLQPLVVRPVKTQTTTTIQHYEIIAGERRWRASQQAGLTTVPCVIKPVDDAVALAIGLVENIQREDLNPLEQAIALERLQQEFQPTQQDVAMAVGRSRTAVTNLLRLRQLQPAVQQLLAQGDLEMGHARALLSLPAQQQVEAAQTVVRRGLSVRQTEAWVRQLQAAPQQADTKEHSIDPNVRRLQQDLSEKLAAPVLIHCNAKGKGTLTIRYNSLDELDGILAHIH